MSSAQASSAHPKYRPDIDGLRAIAVLSVVAFHAAPARLPGGFIGVDLFFVISGFLISSILFKQIDSGQFHFKDFYARRIRRIFPALLVVLVAAYALGWESLLADEYQQLGKHIVAGAGFMSNIVFWSESGYFDNAAETKPLLHLWSLGVEEQFYILWPLLLWLAWKRRFSLLVFTAALTLASLFTNLHEVRQNVVAAFYFPQMRFWELLSGGLLAWITLYRADALRNLGSRLDHVLSKIIPGGRAPASGSILANTLSLLGLLLLAYGLWRINKELRFPGKWAVIPVLAAVLIIAGGSHAWLNRTLLSNKAAVWFGLISYPLYLWHWPLLSFARIIESGTPRLGTRIAAVALSVILAWLTYRFIEQPIRKQARPAIVLSLAVLMAGAAAVGYRTYTSHGWPDRPVVRLNASAQSGEDGGDGNDMTATCGIDDADQKALFAVCAHDKRGHVRYALMGDSKAAALYTGLVRTSRPDGRWLVIGGASTHGAPIPYLDADPDPQRPLTVLASNAIADNPHISTVVLVTAVRALFSLSDGVKNGNVNTYDYHYLQHLEATTNFDAVYQGLNRVVEKFIAAGKKVILVVDNPALPNPQDCIGRETALPLLNRLLGKTNPACRVSLDEYARETQKYRRLLQTIREAHPGVVKIFDPTDIYCNRHDGICGPIRDGRLMYAYTDHISDYAAGLVGQRLNDFIASDGHGSAEEKLH